MLRTMACNTKVTHMRQIGFCLYPVRWAMTWVPLQNKSEITNFSEKREFTVHRPDISKFRFPYW